MGRLLHPTKRKFSVATIPNKRFLVAFCSKIWLFVCKPPTPKSSLLFNCRNKKVVGGKHHILVHYADASAPDSEDVVYCDPFIWNILWFILIKNLVICVPASHTKIKFTLQLQKQKSGRRVTQCSHTLYGGYCTQPKESSPLEPFWMRDFLVHFAVKYDYLCACLTHQNQVYSSTGGTKKW